MLCEITQYRDCEEIQGGKNMPKNVDTTDLMVYGHEAWIETEQSDYAPGETVNAVLRWGHNMRPDGFCRADEFQIFYLDHNGEKVLLTPEKGNGDFYHIRFRAPDAGVYQLIAIYNNTYGHDGNDNWYEGVRRNLPLSETVTNYFQVYTTVFSIGTAHGTVPFYPESRIAFFLEDWSSNSEILRFRLMRDGAAEGLVSTTLVYFDGTEYTEKMLLTDRDGSLLFSAQKPGTYCLIYRAGLDESIPGEYEERAVTSTFTYCAR